MHILVTRFTKVSFVVETIKNCLFGIAHFTDLVFWSLHNRVDGNLTGNAVQKLNFCGVVDGVFMLVDAFLHLIVVFKVN